MKTFNENEKKNNAQKEMVYILYMMVGSCFKSCVCKNKYLEKNLFLYYSELTAGKKERKEQAVLRRISKVIDPLMGLTLAEMKSELRIDYFDGIYYMDFLTGFERVHCEVDEKGAFVLELCEA